MPVPADTRHLSTPWFSLPGTAQAGVQVFALGDVHGRAGAFESALAAIGASPRMGRKRVLVLLGDLVGHGPQGLEVLGMINQARARADVDELIVLPGDHEIMLAQALCDPLFKAEAWALSGGQALLDEAGLGTLQDDPRAQMKALAARLDAHWAQNVLGARGWWGSGDILCVHAGLDPAQERAAFLSQPAGGSARSHWAWIRSPFLNWTGGWDRAGRMVAVHGHTPALTHWVGTDEDMRAFCPLDKRRLCLDAGAQVRSQIAWAEISADRARIHCVQHGRGDAF